MKADSGWLCLHRGFCPAAKEHVTDACVHISKAPDQLPSLNTPAEPGPTGGLRAGSVELFQKTDSLGLSQKERGKALPQDTEGAIIKRPELCF